MDLCTVNNGTLSTNLAQCDDPEKSKRNISVSTFVIAWHFVSFPGCTDLERSWGCWRGRGQRWRGIQSPGRPDTTMSQRGSWGPRCWKRPRGSASTRLWCESACKPCRASRSRSRTEDPATSCWCSSEQAWPSASSSSSTCTQQSAGKANNQQKYYEIRTNRFSKLQVLKIWDFVDFPHCGKKRSLSFIYLSLFKVLVCVKE